jgi:hypothetical protein
MADNRKKILEMLEKKKITTDEAYRLLGAIDDEEPGHSNHGHEDIGSRRSATKYDHKYLRITITPGEEHEQWEHPERVNVRIPMSLLRAGIKLTALMPPEQLDKANKALSDKGIDFDVRKIKPEDLEGLIEAIGDTEIDIDGKNGEKVKVFVE